MAYTNPMKIVNGLALDFSVDAAGGSDVFLMKASDGTVTQTSSVPASKVSSGGNLTEATSAVLTIVGGSGILLGNASIQVKVANTSQSGYLTSTDWNTFNDKLSGSLADSRLLVGNSGGVATARDITGDVTFNSTGVTAIGAGVIVNNDINASAAIAVSKLAALSASLAVASDASGFITTVAGVTTTKLGYLVNVGSDIQGQFTTTNQRIVGIQVSATVLSPGAGQDQYAIVWDQTNARWDLSPAAGGGTLVGPVSSTDNAIARWDGTGGDAVQNSGIIIDDTNNITGVASITLGTAGLFLYDTDASHTLNFIAGSNLASNRNLTFTTGDANRNITLSGDTTLDDWFDQSVKTTGNPSFTSATLSNAGGLHILDSDESHDLIITTDSNLAADRTLTINTGDVSHTVTINASGTFYITGGTDVSLADGGTGASLSDPGFHAPFFWDNTNNVSRFAQLGSGLTYDSATNTFNATLTGAWLLASGGTLTGANTITSNTANQLIFTGTWTATADDQYHFRINPTITHNGTGNQTRKVLLIDPSFTTAVADQASYALHIKPTFTDAFSQNLGSYSIYSENGAAKFIIDVRQAFSIHHNQASSTSTQLIDYAFYIATTTAGSNVNQVALVAKDNAGSSFNRFMYAAATGTNHTLTFYAGLGISVPTLSLNEYGNVGIGIASTVITSTVRQRVRGIGNGTGTLSLFESLDGTPRITLLDNGNCGMFGATTFDTGVGVLAMKNATTPPAAGDADECIIYCKDVTASSEFFVMDESGFETQIS